MSGLLVAYTDHLLEFTQDLFRQKELQWFNEGQLHVTVQLHLKVAVIYTAQALSIVEGSFTN